tara:strand:+ start:1942 stop:2139 length:198 start_codon:yes stop_codon:yes gene_type:complete
MFFYEDYKNNKDYIFTTISLTPTIISSNNDSKKTVKKETHKKKDIKRKKKHLKRTKKHIKRKSYK